jgi:hypothetical protein
MFDTADLHWKKKKIFAFFETADFCIFCMLTGDPRLQQLKHCWRPFELQDGVLLPRICIFGCAQKKKFLIWFQNIFCLPDMFDTADLHWKKKKIFAFFETADFCIFCMLTGDNDHSTVLFLGTAAAEEKMFGLEKQQLLEKTTYTTSTICKNCVLT